MPRHVVDVVALLLLAAHVHAQEPFPKPGADPTGIVVDQHGTKIVGARVALRAMFDDGDALVPAIRNLLQATPLPTAITDKDGEFVLPLTRDHRRLREGYGHRFVLLAEQPGYQRWCEPLPNGLAGYCGSRVVLRRLRATDQIRIEIEQPIPGLQLALRRRWGEHEDVSEVFEVPSDGKLEVAFPLSPWPPRTSAPHEPVVIEAQCQLGPRRDWCCALRARWSPVTTRWRYAWRGWGRSA